MIGDNRTVFSFRLGFFFSFLFILLLSCAGCSAKINALDSIFSKEAPVKIESMDELEEYVEDKISQGEKEISLETSSLSLDDIQGINENLDGYYGSVDKCESRRTFLSANRNITLYCDISDNYYVEKYIMVGQEIPADSNMAIELADFCQSLLNEMNQDLGDDASVYEKEMWIHDYLVSQTSYGFPEGENENTSDSSAHESYGALILHKAVCNGYSFAMKLLCDLSDIPCKIIVGKGDGESHAWNLVEIDSSWYHVDVTWDDPSPDRKGRIIYTYFNINDERAALGHEWIEANYPEADQMDYNYYIKNALYCKNYKEFYNQCISILEDGETDALQLMVADYDDATYSEKNMQFLLACSGASKINYQSIGEAPYKTLYITFKR